MGQHGCVDENECPDIHMHGQNAWLPEDPGDRVPEYLGTEGPPWVLG